MQKGTWVGYLWGWWMKMEIGDSGTCSEKDNQKNTGGGDKEHERRMDTQRERETRRGGGGGRTGGGAGAGGEGRATSKFWRRQQVFTLLYSSRLSPILVCLGLAIFLLLDNFFVGILLFVS